jgi:hypothetical protein
VWMQKVPCQCLYRSRSGSCCLDPRRGLSLLKLAMDHTRCSEEAAILLARANPQPAVLPALQPDHSGSWMSPQFESLQMWLDSPDVHASHFSHIPSPMDLCTHQQECHRTVWVFRLTGTSPRTCLQLVSAWWTACRPTRSCSNGCSGTPRTPSCRLPQLLSRDSTSENRTCWTLHGISSPRCRHWPVPWYHWQSWWSRCRVNMRL